MTSTPDPLAGTTGYLVDNSAFARADHPAVAPLWSSGLAHDRLYSRGPFVLEALYSSRNLEEMGSLFEELIEALSYVETTERTWRLAYEAALAMATVAPQFHRRPMVDYLVAAAAHEHGLGVLHYDHDYDHILQHTTLDYVSRWIAPPGTLDESQANPARLLKRDVNARLAQFSGEEAVPVYEAVVATLDRAITAAGNQRRAPRTLPDRCA